MRYSFVRTIVIFDLLGFFAPVVSGKIHSVSYLSSKLAWTGMTHRIDKCYKPQDFEPAKVTLYHLSDASARTDIIHKDDEHI